MKYLAPVAALMLLVSLAGSLFAHPLSAATAWPVIGLLAFAAILLSGKTAEATE